MRWFVVIPMMFMYVTTLTALAMQFGASLQAKEMNQVTLGAIVVLFVLALLSAFNYVRKESFEKERLA